MVQECYVVRLTWWRMLQASTQVNPCRLSSYVGVELKQNVLQIEYIRGQTDEERTTPR